MIVPALWLQINRDYEISFSIIIFIISVQLSSSLSGYERRPSAEQPQDLPRSKLNGQIMKEPQHSHMTTGGTNNSHS